MNYLYLLFNFHYFESLDVDYTPWREYYIENINKIKKDGINDYYSLKYWIQEIKDIKELWFLTKNFPLDSTENKIENKRTMGVSSGVPVGISNRDIIKVIKSRIRFAIVEIKDLLDTLDSNPTRVSVTLPEPLERVMNTSVEALGCRMIKFNKLLLSLNRIQVEILDKLLD